MKERMYSILNIRRKESRLVFKLMLLQFLLGIATSFLYTVSYAVFLETFSIQELAKIYLFTSFALAFVNFIYEKLEHSLNIIQLFKRIILFSAILLILIWVAIFFTGKEWLILCLLVCNTIIYMVVGYAFWGLTALVFNVRESKRVFSIIGAGDIPSKLIGYLAVSLIAPFIGAATLLWISVATFLVAFFFISKAFSEKELKWSNIPTLHHHDHELSQKKVGVGFVKEFFKTELIFALSLLSVITYIVFTFVDFTFLSQVKLAFKGVKELASFIALFFVIGRLFAIILKLIISSRVIAKLGLTTSLLIIPVVLLVICFYIITTPNTLSDLYIFGIMALLSEVLRSIIQEPVFFILFQPLQLGLRLKGHLISKGHMALPALLIVGLFLLTCYQFNIPVSIYLIIKILIGTLLIWVGIIFFIRKAYFKTLHHAIRKGSFTGNEILSVDEKTISLILEKVKSGSNVEIINAFQILEEGKFVGLEKLYYKRVMDADPVIKVYILRELEKSGKTENIAKLYSLLDKEENPDVRKALFRTLSWLDENFAEKYFDSLSGFELEIRKEIIINLLKKENLYGIIFAGHELNRILKSNDEADRVAGISIIMELKKTGIESLIARYLQDPAIEVRRMAMLAVGRLKIESLFPVLIQALTNETDLFIGRQALIEVGDELFADKRLHQLPRSPETRLAIIKMAAKINGPHSTEYLLQHLHKAPHHDEYTINALWEKKYESDKKHVHLFDVKLRHYLEKIKTKIFLYDAMSGMTEAALLKNSMMQEIRADLKTCLKLCSILYNREQINRFLELISLTENTKIHNAIEMLEMIVPKKYFQELDVAFELFIDDSNRLKHRQHKTLPVIITEILEASDYYFNIWTNAICLYIAGKNGLTDLIALVQNKAQYDTQPILKETREFALSH